MMKQGKRVAFILSVFVLCAVVFFGSPPGVAVAEKKIGESVLAYVNKAPGTWYTGRIDAIDSTYISIADVTHAFAPNVIFVSKYGFTVSRSDFYTGKKVRMLLDSNYKCTILLEL